MRGISILALLLVALFVPVVVDCAAPKPAQASSFVPFISWNPFDADVEVDEPTPVATLTQMVGNRPFFVWGQEMQVAPQVLVGHPDVSSVEIGVSFPTPKGKGVSNLWWTDDPRLDPREENLKRWNRVSPDMIRNGEWKFPYKPNAGLNTVRIVAEIFKAKETTRRPFFIGKSGSYKSQLRGAMVRFTGISIAGGSGVNPRYYDGGDWNLRNLALLLHERNGGGTSLIADLNKEEEPDELPVDDVPRGNGRGNGNGQREDRRLETQPDATESNDASNGACGSQSSHSEVDERNARWVLAKSNGFSKPPTVKLRWSDGSESEPFTANGIDKVIIPDEVNGFQAYLLVDGKWHRNYLLDGQGKPTNKLYPVPTKPGGRITIEIALLRSHAPPASRAGGEGG